MLQSERKGTIEGTYDSVDSAILKYAVRCPVAKKCLKRAIQYKNFSVISDDIEAEMFHDIGKWFDENNRPSLRKFGRWACHDARICFFG
jgi:hypothetical protein